MKFACFVCSLVLLAVTTALAQSNPVPFVNEPPVPLDAAPGGAGFTLTVNGTGFVSTSTINWNGTPLATTFVNSSQLTATVPAANITKASTASITVSSPSPGGGTSNVVFFAVSAPTTLQFTSLPSNDGMATTSTPITADFNHDGNLDFAEISLGMEDQYVIFLFLGNGDGTFQPPKYIENLAGVQGFTIGDFNGDGKLDFAAIVCTYDVNEIQCFVNILLGNGDGTFSMVVALVSLPGNPLIKFWLAISTGTESSTSRWPSAGAFMLFSATGTELFRIL
jgi:hypothetical protein